MRLRDRNVVLLDAGGTLITLDYDSVRETFAETGISPTDEELELAEARARAWADVAARSRLEARELWNGYFGRLLTHSGVPESFVPRAMERLWVKNRDLGLWRRPISGVREVLERLSAAGKRLAVVSNAEGRVAHDLNDAGLGRYLETVVDSHLVGVSKPNPRIFEIALERLSVARDEALYVGDVPAFDVDGARAAGIPPVLIDPHGLHASVAVDRIDHLSGLLELMELA